MPPLSDPYCERYSLRSSPVTAWPTSPILVAVLALHGRGGRLIELEGRDQIDEQRDHHHPQDEDQQPQPGPPGIVLDVAQPGVAHPAQPEDRSQGQGQSARGQHLLAERRQVQVRDKLGHDLEGNDRIAQDFGEGEQEQAQRQQTKDPDLPGQQAVLARDQAVAPLRDLPLNHPADRQQDQPHHHPFTKLGREADGEYDRAHRQDRARQEERHEGHAGLARGLPRAALRPKSGVAKQQA